MTEEIDFQDSGSQVSVTIDKETQSLPIKKINKSPTYIGLNKSINTALKNNIEVDAFIYYIKKTEEVDTENQESNDENQEADTEITQDIDNENQETDDDESQETDTEITQERDYIYSPEKDDIRFLTGINDDNLLKLDIDGTVTITIYNGKEIYYIKDVRFQEGHIKDNISNTLPLGTYTMVIQYNGNKYFEESTLTVGFNIEKRLATCELEKEKYYGDLSETINIAGTLKDSEKATPINNCTFYYSFNGEEKTVISGVDGRFNFNITIPEPNISHCNLLDNESSENEISDDELNPVYEYPNDPDIKKYYPNASYIINLYTDNESYHLENTEIEVIAKRAPTNIIVDSKNPDEQTNILQVTGTGFATYNDRDNDIKYGKINIELPDFNYKHEAVNIKNGTFSADINLADVYRNYNSSKIQSLEPYDTTNIINTSIEVKGDTSINEGDMFTVKAKVKAVGDEEYVKYGVLIFNLYSAHEVDKNGTLAYENDTYEDGTTKPPVYRYATEIDRTGVGIFNFNTSQSKIYNVQVEYIGMFGYKGSLSSKHSIIIQEKKVI